jgi:hypothetical protein
MAKPGPQLRMGEVLDPRVKETNWEIRSRGIGTTDKHYITFFRCIGGPYRRDCPSETRDSIVFSERLVLL